MRANIVCMLFVVAATVSASSQSANGPTISWSDSTRDVYIDNELDRSAQVLTTDSPSRLALISTKLASAVVLNVPDRIVNTMAKDAFQFAAGRTSATSNAGEGKPVGKFTRVDGVYFFVVEGKPVLIRSHPGATGELTTDKLWETVPVWRSEMDAYQPNSDAVAHIKADEKETTVTLAFGTWCPDSKNYIPRLMKALRASDNSKIRVKLVGIDNQFHEPVDFVQSHRITNVPTVIVERGGNEIGRIVETPASKTMEEDLASILDGKPPVHTGRWDRGPQLASGVYSYRDRGGKEVGTETFEMFSTAEGGFLVHSKITTGDLITEVFHRVDARRRASFIEVTKLHGDDRTRTRFNFDGNTMTARTRGSVSGVISQTLEVPDRIFFSSPAVAAQGLMQSLPSDRYQISGYAAPQEFEKATGALTTIVCESKGDEAARVPAGEFKARHVTRKNDKETYEWWLHAQLGVPVKGQASGIEYVLTRFDVSSK